MAKILFGPLASDARNKIAGLVFGKTHAGSYLRRKSSPTQPRTSSQIAVRANLTANAKSWSDTLTPAQRLSFTDLAAATTKKDRLGQTHTLTGLQLYQLINRNLHTLGLPPLTTAPTDLNVSDLGGLDLQYEWYPPPPLTGPGLTVAPLNPPDPSEGLVITATAALPPGLSFLNKSKYRIIATYPPGSIPPMPIDITAGYQAKFGQLQYYSTYSVGLYNIRSTNGAASSAYTASIIPLPPPPP